MQLSISVNNSDQFFHLEISNSLTLEELINLIKFESNLANFKIYFNGNELSGNRQQTLQQLGFGDDEMIMIDPIRTVVPQRRPIDKIEEQFLHAMEHSPESFTKVSMLYINTSLNGTPIKAFVDSGAQQTIISSILAAQCGLDDLIDKRFAGAAIGVGSTPIIGRIHSAMLKIETQFIAVSLTVLDTHVDFLLGLDMLRKYQGVIDLKRNLLRIADVETRFLNENEIPKDFETVDGALLGGNNRGGSFGGNIFSDAPATATATATATALPTNNRHSEGSINQLVSIGATRSQAIEMLNQTNGNVELAASMLF